MKLYKGYALFVVVPRLFQTCINYLCWSLNDNILVPAIVVKAKKSNVHNSYYTRKESDGLLQPLVSGRCH